MIRQLAAGTSYGIVPVTGAFWVAMAGVINAPWNYILVRSFIECAGAVFVNNQIWCSLKVRP
jgi:hypothetical protein